MKIKNINNALLLPSEWDKLANCYFQRKYFLLHCQIWNHCNQRYYLAYKDDELIAGAVVYTLRLNLFTYYKKSLPVKMHIAGIPCSVSCPGILGDTSSTTKLFEYICSNENGIKLALNIETLNGIPQKMFTGNTLPAIKLVNSFSSWSEYLSLLRADYRRRLFAIERKSSEVRFLKGSCNEFTLEMYDQYLQVYDKSSAKLEKLDYRFFKHLPEVFNLTTANINNRLGGWFITLNADEELYFFLGGVDYSLNEKFGIYHRLLTEIIRLGINLGVKRIDLGQTAEIPKMRLGGKGESRYMIAFHGNYLIQTILRRSAKLLDKESL
jgi:hypothetical protein